MFGALILSLFTLWASAAPQIAQAPPSEAGAKARSLASDPYAPLRLYDGKWDVVLASDGKPADTAHIENHCAKVGDFFACNQFMNGKNMALVVMLPSHPLDNGGYAYRNQALRADGDGPGTWGKLEIVGDRWVYSNDGTDNGKKTYWQTINLFSGPDKIHFEVQKSDDGVKWTTTMSGDEARAK
jgi:hypothetical protein